MQEHDIVTMKRRITLKAYDYITEDTILKIYDTSDCKPIVAKDYYWNSV